MRAFEIDTRRFPVLVRLEPAPRTKTPAIACLQSRETEFRSCRDEVVSPSKGVLQELIGQAGADRVRAKVLWSRVATAITIKARYRVLSARFEGLAENVFCIVHGRILHPAVNHFEPGKLAV